MRFLDTNILLYSISTDPGETDKRDRAINLLDHDDCALSVQVLQEFYVQATRPGARNPLPHELAVGLMESWTRFPVQAIDRPLLWAALEIKARYRYSYWDSAIIAAARALGCDELYSEDMGHGQRIDETTIINPFR